MSSFHGTNGIAFGPDGRLYVADFLGGCISAVDLPTAEVEMIVPAGDVVQSPDDLAFGADGSMYITDLVPGRVWRRDPRGEFTLVTDEVKVPNGIACAGNRLFVNEMRPGGRVLELFPDGGAPVVLAGDLPMGNAMQLGPDGYLYYPRMLSGEVHRISPEGGTPELVAEDVQIPVAVRFDRAGVLLILSAGADGDITRISPDGSRQTVTTGLFGLDNAAVDEDNRVYVSSFASGGIAEVHPDGRIRQIVPQGLVGPYGLAVSGGTVHVADHYRVAGERTMRSTHGIVADGDELHTTSQYGEVRTGKKVRAKGLSCPLGIAVRADGALVVAETGAGRVVAVDAGDTITVVANGFSEPVDVAFDADGRCYVSDEQGAVYRIDDGRPVPIAEGLAAPQGLTVRGDELVVVEAGRRRLLAISLVTGEIRTEAGELDLRPLETQRRALFTHGMPGCPRGFAGLTVAPDGTLHVSGDGVVLEVSVAGDHLDHDDDPTDQQVDDSAED